MNNYPYYGNNQMYMQDLQNMRERIDRQMMQMQQPQQMQNQQPQGITQNFQLAPNNSTINDFDAKYAKDIDEVKNTLTLKNTLFVNKDMSILWFKDAAGNIKSYSLAEIIQKDEKDILIDQLKAQNEQNNQIILDLQKQMNDLKSNVIQNNNIVDNRNQKNTGGK
jgi:hypothetical protein